MKAMERFVEKLPQGVGYDWTGLSYQERQAGGQAAPLYAFSILVIFLCLAALYESWPVPFSILLALPLGAIGGVIASSLMGMPNDVYFQIGLLTTLGLTTKNAILIVQFAKSRVEEEGMELTEATLEAAKLRLRPIVMTSLAFGFGVLPLAVATGAGAGAQRAIGTGVLGGVVTATFLVTIFAPLFFVLIEQRFGKKGRRHHAKKSRGHLLRGRNTMITKDCLLLLIGAVIILSGCTMAPTYTRPDAPVPPTWPAGDAYAENKTMPAKPAAADLQWRDFFTDERLRKVIETALQNNRDLRLAALNVQKARGMYGIQRAELLPVINASGSGSGERLPGILTNSGQPKTTHQYDVRLGISAWEIDFFGRLRSLKDAALEEYLATEQARRSAQILLISSVAEVYLTLAADREALKLSRSTLEASRRLMISSSGAMMSVLPRNSTSTARRPRSIPRR